MAMPRINLHIHNLLLQGATHTADDLVFDLREYKVFQNGVKNPQPVVLGDFLSKNLGVENKFIKFYSWDAETPKELGQFFNDIEMAIEERNGDYVVVYEGDDYEIASLYWFNDYIVELSDGGLGIYFK